MGKKIATESTWQPYHYIISCCRYHFIILLTSCSSLSAIDIDVMSGEWTHKDSGIGSGVDSYFEYLLKAALLFKDQDYLDVSTTLPLLFFFCLSYSPSLLNDYFLMVDIYLRRLMRQSMRTSRRILGMSQKQIFTIFIS